MIWIFNFCLSQNSPENKVSEFKNYLKLIFLLSLVLYQILLGKKRKMVRILSNQIVTFILQENLKQHNYQLYILFPLIFIYSFLCFTYSALKKENIIWNSTQRHCFEMFWFILSYSQRKTMPEALPFIIYPYVFYSYIHVDSFSPFCKVLLTCYQKFRPNEVYKEKS